MSFGAITAFRTSVATDTGDLKEPFSDTVIPFAFYKDVVYPVDSMKFSPSKNQFCFGS